MIHISWKRRGVTNRDGKRESGVRVLLVLLFVLVFFFLVWLRLFVLIMTPNMVLMQTKEKKKIKKKR